MSSYQHLQLPSEGEYIRLLCLLPNKSKAEPLQCKIHDYSLWTFGLRTHRYEALSYVWGDPNETLPIYINNSQFLITTNLHAALTRLRDHTFERILWADAICIDQKDLEEQSQQVQLMASIYSNAHRVIVWLGNETEDSNRAFKDIQLVANGERSRQEINQQAILSLLQRAWFQRIWILQEVAAARHVVIMCGSSEIDGYAFCLGLKPLLQELSYIAHPELRSLPSLINLIQQAGLRPKHIKRSLEKYSLGICSLAELVDMFHTRQASNILDKVYALVGMSLGDPNKAGLQPNYFISWEELFVQLVQFILGKDVFVETSGQRAVIKSKGCILGQVSSIRRDDKQNVNIIVKRTARDFGETIEWTLPASAKPIQERDIICFQYGVSKPTIIRLCKDHFDIIVIAATPLDGSGNSRWPETFPSMTQFSRDFLLNWDWESPQGKSQDQGEYEVLIKTYSQALKNLKAKDYSVNLIGLWNDIMILDDLGEYEEADKRFSEAISCYVEVFGKEHLLKPTGQYGRTLLSFAAGEGHEDVVKLLLETGDPDIKDRKYGQTPLLWAAQNGHEVAVKLLLDTSEVEVDNKDYYYRTPLNWAAQNGHEAVVKLLLETNKVEINEEDISDLTPLLGAAQNGHEAVVKLLLESDKVEADKTDDFGGQTPLAWAAENGHEAVVKLLLGSGKVEADKTGDFGGQTPLSLASKNGHETVVKLLLETGKVEVNSKNNFGGQTPLSLASENGHEVVVKLLLQTNEVEVNEKDNSGQTPLFYAARNGHEAVIKLLLGTGKVETDSKNINGETPLIQATRYGHNAIVKLLLETD